MAALVALRRRGLVGADNTVADDSGLNADDIPDDAVVALHLLREQFPPSAGAGGLHPVALVSQIYSLVPDRTAVDRQLDQAMRRQEVRLFRMVGHATDNLAMAADDYEAAIRRAVDIFVAKRKGGSRDGAAGKQPRLSGDAARNGRQLSAGSNGRDEDGRGFRRTAAGGGSSSRDRPVGLSTEEIVDRFLYGVLPENPFVSISAFDIKASLAAPRNALVGGPPPDVACGGAAGRMDDASSEKSAREANERPLRTLTDDEAEDAVTFLDDAGLIIRKDVNTYLFAVPGIGMLQGQILQGRQELLNMMGRKKFGEILVREAEKLKLKNSALGARAHASAPPAAERIPLMLPGSDPIALLQISSPRPHRPRQRRSDDYY